MKRTYVRVIVRMDSDWRIGSWDTQSADAVETLRDHLNRGPMVPGTSIAGALRASVAEAPARDLFGPAPGSPREASTWWVLGTMVTDACINQRHRVKIDRERGAAAAKGLFAIDEVGHQEDETTTIAIYFRSEASDPQPFLKLLGTWQPRIGGGRTTGLGLGTVTSIRYRTLDLDTKDGVLALLAPGGDTAVERVAGILRKGSAYEVTSAKRPTLLQAAIHCAFLAQPEERQTKTHGSAWKGLLRSRVEYIARSLNLPMCPDTPEWVGCGDCPVCRAFGSTERGGAWEFRDSTWAKDDTPEKLTRIAIDRFTGGARDGALFYQHYERNIRMRLTVLGPPLDGDDAWVNRALLHALRDLDDGLITIGPEGASGFGLASVTQVQFAEKNPVDLTDLEPVSKGVVS